MKVWQIACGERGRYYDDIFLDHDVMFLGPGEPGEYNWGKYKKWAAEGRIKQSGPGQVRSFREKVQPGDIILLRKGYRVTSIGRARDHNCYFEKSLDDVYGWQLQHCRSVSWQRDLEEELADIQLKQELFARRKQIWTFTSVDDHVILGKIKHLISRCTIRPSKGVPAVPDPLTPEALGERLFAKGIPNNSVDHVLRALDRQRRLATWYKAERKNSGRPTEHEVVAHMVLPLLLALGWSEQLLAVEWRSIDLAAFFDTPTTAEHCTLVCEVKKGGAGMQNVWQQARRYVDRLELTSCRNILVTEGARFYLYSRSDDGWSDTPTGYLNVAKIRERHVAPKNTSAVDTIVRLTPMNIMYSASARG